MTTMNWPSLKNNNIAANALRRYERMSVKTRTDLEPADLNAEKGSIIFLAFTPQKCATFILDYKTVENSRRLYKRLEAGGGVSARGMMVLSYKAWHAAQSDYEALRHIEAFILAVAAQLDLTANSFDELQRITLFCEQTGELEVAVQPLLTKRSIRKI